MNIGFVTTWLPRGAAYVTINYIKLVSPEHRAFVYARGGEYYDKNFRFGEVPVHKGLRLESTNICVKDFVSWICENKLDMVIFNEQDSIEAVCVAKKKCPNVQFGAYVDYYKESTVREFSIYDFLICNTKRHLSVFSWHPQCLYLPWGTDIQVYNCQRQKKRQDTIRFFHSMGMSNRKGTEILIDTFKRHHLKDLGARLIIHTQKNIEHLISTDEAKKAGIEIVYRSVPAPGLYYLGDVYVYPAKLDGLGLTMYEALSCGMPVIATDIAPMNEVINNQNGRLVKVKRMFSRSDGYYWPLAIVDEESLLEALLFYIHNADNMTVYATTARAYAEKNLNLLDRKEQLLNFLSSVKKIDTNQFGTKWLLQNAAERKSARNHFLVSLLPEKIESLIRNRIEQKRMKDI